MISVGGGLARCCNKGALPSIVVRGGPAGPVGGGATGAVAALGGSRLDTAFAPPGGTRLEVSNVLALARAPGALNGVLVVVLVVVAATGGAGSGGKGARAGGKLLRVLDLLDLGPPVGVPADNVCSE